jgi:hypothetical protein
MVNKVFNINAAIGLASVYVLPWCNCNLCRELLVNGLMPRQQVQFLSSIKRNDDLELSSSGIQQSV